MPLHVVQSLVRRWVDDSRHANVSGHGDEKLRIKNTKTNFYQPTATETAVGFFFLRLIAVANQVQQQMKKNNETMKNAVSEKLALLAHLYLELRMPPAEAVSAAQADLRDLDGLLPVEEAA